MGDRTTTQSNIAGEFAVLSQLALHGFDANLTLGNTKGVDILVSDPTTKKFARVEVKTNRYHEGYEKLFGGGKFISWILMSKSEVVEYKNLFYCLVAIMPDDTFRYFIVPAEKVAKYIKEQHLYWMKNGHDKSENKIRKFRLALEDPSLYQVIETSMASDYENRWDLIRADSRE